MPVHVWRSLLEVLTHQIGSDPIIITPSHVEVLMHKIRFHPVIIAPSQVEVLTHKMYGSPAHSAAREQTCCRYVCWYAAVYVAVGK